VPSIAATSLFCGPDGGLLKNAELRHEGGLITAARRFIVPALVNAHDHARPAASSFGTMNVPLEAWILRSVMGTPPDAYLAATAALGKSARAGCAPMMVHYTRPSGTMAIIDEARAIARAASDVGIRLAFALAVRDQHPIVYGDSADVLSQLSPPHRKAVEDMFPRSSTTPQGYISLVEEIASAIAGPMVDVQFGPAGVQWCSRPLLEAIADNSARTGRRIHMHLLETAYQRAWADRAFPQAVVRYLSEIGFLSERLTVAHCVHARPDELDMIATSGTRIVTNFSSNMHIHSGLAPIADAHRRGCAIAVGVDGLALDEDDDTLREHRLVQMMHDGVGFERTWTRAEFFGLAVRNGRRATGAPDTGELRPGAPADFVVLDLDHLDRDAITEVDPLELLFARGNMGHIREVVVAGRTIARDGMPTGIDLPAIERELAARYRKNLGGYADFLAAWPSLQGAVGNWFKAHCGCA
jgi:cytosine/adenosine deaminase-related metal-dependent hydrolase